MTHTHKLPDAASGLPAQEGPAVELATLSVVSHGHGPMLQALLADLSRQQAIERCQIIVTLNLNDEPFDAGVFPGLRLTVIRNAQPNGFGANHNAAFAHACGRWFVILNPDLRLPDPTTLSRLMSPAACASQADLIAPAVVDAEGHLEDSVRRNLTPWSLVRRRIGQRLEPLRPDRPSAPGQPFYWLAGMFLVVAPAAYRAVGGFDERFFLYCEDYDLCARLYAHGHMLRYDGSVQVVHLAQRTSHRSLKYLRWHLSSLLRVWCSSAFWRVTFAPRG